LLNQKGWWQSISLIDIDADGDQDIIAGNFGLNSRLKASAKEPVRLYLNDYDNNGRMEQVITYYLQGKEMPFASKIQLEKSLPVLKKQFLYAEDFAKASLNDLFGKEKLEAATKLEATQMASMVLINEGKGKYNTMQLPAEAQFSNIRSVVPINTIDANVNVGKQTMAVALLLGNFGYNNIEIGRQDANFGTVLQIAKSTGIQFSAIQLPGLTIKGEVRRALPIQIGKEIGYVLAKNNGQVQIIKKAR